MSKLYLRVVKHYLYRFYRILLVPRNLIYLALFPFFISFIVICFKWSIACVALQPYLHINTLCGSVADGEHVGNLCSHLCHKREISSVSCKTLYLGKEIVFTGQWNNKTVVFKSPKKPNTLLSNDDYDSESEFIQIIKSNIRLKFNIEASDKEVMEMAYMYYDTKDSHNYWRERNNIWVLMQDNEYLATVLYRKLNIFPKILGVCSTLYAVEMLEPLSVSAYNHWMKLYDSKDSWLMRVRLSMMILEYLQELESKVPEPLHLCDVKMRHFGMSKDLVKVQYLDLDSVHPRSIVHNITGDGSQCIEHSDCDYFDCRSFCNQVTFRCQFGVANNNLQIVCEKIFLGWRMSGTVLVGGLLMGSHTPEALLELLETCANPAEESGLPRATASKDLWKRLHTMLFHIQLA